MRLTPEYGQTPVGEDELAALVPTVRDLLGEPVSKVAIYDLEQAAQEEVAERLLAAVLDGVVDLDELLSDHFVRDVHRQL
jgi:hypothetical protein